MRWIGLTGGIATGKSTVASLLRKSGIAVADADQYAREALSKGSEQFHQVVQAFGPEILSSTGDIDRARLGVLVFQNQEFKKRLEGIVHPFVQEKIKALRTGWEKEGRGVAIYDVPLLFEKNLAEQFDGIILVVATEDLQRQRMKTRNAWNDEEIRIRLENQLSLAEKTKRAHYIVINNGSLADLELQVRDLIPKLTAG